MGARRNVGGDAFIGNKKRDRDDILLQPLSTGRVDTQVSVLGGDVLFKDAKNGEEV